MEFMIKKSSNWWNEEHKKPLRGNNKIYSKMVKIYDDGTKEKRWFIRIDNLEELIQFYKEVKFDLILSETMFGEPYYTLEIYDDYRE